MLNNAGDRTHPCLKCYTLKIKTQPTQEMMTETLAKIFVEQKKSSFLCYWIAKFLLMLRKPLCLYYLNQS